LAEICDRLEHAQQCYKYFYDEHHRDLTFDVDQWVWLHLIHRSTASLDITNRNKLGPKYFGPFQVQERISDVAYQLQRAHLHNVFHVGLVKPYHGETSTVPGTMPPIKHVRVCLMSVEVVRSRVARG
jgi:hypothetical protein